MWVDDAKFDEGSSTTYKSLGRTGTIPYQSGSVSGNVGEDVVAFGGYSVPNQDFLLANSINVSPSSSGHIGLSAPDAPSYIGVAPFWANARAKDPSIDSRISFKLPGISGGRETRAEEHIEQTGVLTVGGVNTTLFTGDVEFLPLVTFGGLRTHWALPVLGLYPICALSVLGCFSHTRANLRDYRRWAERRLAAWWLRFL